MSEQKQSCTCDECEDTRKRYNAAIANGFVWRAKSIDILYNDLQRAHVKRRQVTENKVTDKKHPLNVIPKGTRVRVTFEGTVSSIGCVRSSDRWMGERLVFHDDIVEVIAPPDPEWWPPQDRDVALRDGSVWEKCGSYWYRPLHAARGDEDFRDAILIARDRKPYPPREEK